MKRALLYVSLLVLISWQSYAQKVVSMKVDGSINPASALFIKDGIKKAEKENAECLIIHLNTPGGLLKSTRVIVSDILASPVPIIVYVSPGGAHAGSAGVFIALAAHIAVMAPGTNIGAAHPVSMQGSMDSTMSEKATNDAAAFIRSIAAQRNRNVAWAERAVRRSYSYSADEALEDSVIDLIASTEKELLELIDGKSVVIGATTKTLHTKNASIETHDMGFLEKLLDIISDPNITYILFLLGMYGLMFEIYNPGAIFPGVIGGISMILALYSMNTLPINYAGLALIVLAIILFLLEIKIVSHGILAIGGVIALLLGSFMLIRSSGSPLEFVRISRTVIFAATLVSALFFLFIVGAGLKAQRAMPVTGLSGMIGSIGEVVETLAPTGLIKIQGEIWKAESPGANVAIGDKVRIKKIDGLKLTVEPISFHA
jgi:membrane-bound serine protease (ClpP class)